MGKDFCNSQPERSGEQLARPFAPSKRDGQLSRVELRHGKNGPIQILSLGIKFASHIGPGQNMAAKFGPGGPGVAAIFDPRIEFCCRFPTFQNLLLLCRTKYGCNISSCPGTESG